MDNNDAEHRRHLAIGVFEFLFVLVCLVIRLLDGGDGKLEVGFVEVMSIHGDGLRLVGTRQGQVTVSNLVIVEPVERWIRPVGTGLSVAGEGERRWLIKSLVML